jgi:hypothetical protein
MLNRLRTMRGFLPRAGLVQAGLLLLALPVAAQVRFGELSTTSNGSISTGYTADYGNLTPSDHGLTVGGNANFSGSFHDPKFLSFNSAFYLNQSRANSSYQSTSNASGLAVSSTIFAGSSFPGSISYSKAYNSEGNYAVPGLANYVTHGDNDSFGINWSENLPDAPSVSASFISGGSQYSVYGNSDKGNNSFRSLNLHSNYRLVGFNMGAYYSLGVGHSLIPEVVAGEQISEVHTGTGGYGFNVSHRLPFQGSISTAFNESSWNTDYLGSRTNESTDIFTAQATLHPAEMLFCSAGVSYSDNLSGQLFGSLVAAGSPVPGVNSDQSSNSLDMTANASYIVSRYFQTSVFAERRSQLFEGENYGDNSYGGSASYSHKFLDGNFNAAMTLTANNDDQNGEDALGVSTDANYSDVVMGWHLNGSFRYGQNLQTLLITYMNSVFSYAGSASRGWGQFHLGVGAGASKTGLTDQPGTDSSNQNYSAAIGYSHLLTATGNYAKSDGQALLTGAGLVPVPVPSPILPSNLVAIYGGDSYSFALSSMPVKGLSLSGSWAKSISNTAGAGGASANENDEMNALVLYQVRKLNFTSGYSRLNQGFSGLGSQPQMVSTFYMGLSRWFNFF